MIEISHEKFKNLSNKISFTNKIDLQAWWTVYFVVSHFPNCTYWTRVLSQGSRDGINWITWSLIIPLIDANVKSPNTSCHSFKEFYMSWPGILWPSGEREVQGRSTRIIKVQIFEKMEIEIPCLFEGQTFFVAFLEPHLRPFLLLEGIF